MTIDSTLRTLRAGIVTILACGVLFALVGGVVAGSAPVRYTAVARIFVPDPYALIPGNDSVPMRARRIHIQIGALRAAEVSGGVLAAEGVDISPADAGRRVALTQDGDSDVILASVKDRDPRVARALARAAAAGYAERVNAEVELQLALLREQAVVHESALLAEEASRAAASGEGSTGVPFEIDVGDAERGLALALGGSRAVGEPAVSSDAIGPWYGALYGLLAGLAFGAAFVLVRAFFEAPLRPE